MMKGTPLVMWAVSAPLIVDLAPNSALALPINQGTGTIAECLFASNSYWQLQLC